MAAAFTTQTCVHPIYSQSYIKANLYGIQRYNLVTQETTSAYSEMMKAEGWTQAEVFVSNCNRIPSKVQCCLVLEDVDVNCVLACATHNISLRLWSSFVLGG